MIANARLFTDLGEALEMQTATGDVLALISEHPGDLAAVVQGIMEQANRLCDGDASGVWRLGRTVLDIDGRYLADRQFGAGMSSVGGWQIVSMRG